MHPEYDDYEAVDETVILTNVITTNCVKITIKDDDYFETHETFGLKLTSSDPSVVLDPDMTVIMIMNDDGMSDC